MASSISIESVTLPVPATVAAPLLEQAPRVFAIDVLRGLAILLVMGVHVPAYPIWSTAGWIGVDLFFVLSGFLISNLLFSEYRREGRIRLARFFVRRALKLYPSFYFLMAVTLCYCTAAGFPFTWKQLAGELTLTQNYAGSIWGHTWSLAVEEHFYLLLPLLLALLMRLAPGAANPFRALPWIFAVIFVTCLMLRIWTANAYPFDHRLHFEPSHLRFDALFFGVFLSYLHNFAPHVLKTIMERQALRLPLSVLGVAALTPAIFLEYNDPWIYTLGFASASLGCGMMLLCSVYPEPGRKGIDPGFGSKALARMGRYSYTIYLWHVPLAMPFMWIASRTPHVNPFALHAVYFVACVAAGVAASRLVELPGLRFRDRLTRV